MHERTPDRGKLGGRLGPVAIQCLGFPRGQQETRWTGRGGSSKRRGVGVLEGLEHRVTEIEIGMIGECFY